MFWNKCKKYIVKCFARNATYRYDEYSRYDVFTYEYSFRFADPEIKRILYVYTDRSDSYNLNSEYLAKVNSVDGTFKIIKEV